jgi:rhodanese-related sulfurtransferase
MNIEQVMPANLADWAKAHAGARLLDVREPWEVQHASVQPSPALGGLAWLHIPMMELPARIAELGEADDAAPIAVLCHHGMRSLQVAAWLGAQGFAVANVRGGIDLWSQTADSAVPTY